MTQFVNSCAALTRKVALVSLSTLTFYTAAAAGLDHGIDPAHLGKGDWLYVMSDATNHLGGNVPEVTDVKSLMEYYKKQEIDFVAVKAGTGADEFPSAAEPQFTPEL